MGVTRWCHDRVSVHRGLLGGARTAAGHAGRKDHARGDRVVDADEEGARREVLDEGGVDFDVQFPAGGRAEEVGDVGDQSAAAGGAVEARSGLVEDDGRFFGEARAAEEAVVVVHGSSFAADLEAEGEVGTEAEEPLGAGAQGRVERDFLLPRAVVEEVVDEFVGGEGRRDVGRGQREDERRRIHEVQAGAACGAVARPASGHWARGAAREGAKIVCSRRRRRGNEASSPGEQTRGRIRCVCPGVIGCV